MAIAIIAAAALVPILTASAVVVWYHLIRRNPEAVSLAGGVAIGLAAGALFGTAIGGGLILLVATVVRPHAR